MRKITFGGANSLGNYLARPDHAVDWLLWTNEADAVMADYWKTIDTILMGRKTYEVALRQGKGGATLAARLPTSDLPALKKEVDAIARSLVITRAIEVEKPKPEPGKK